MQTRITAGKKRCSKCRRKKPLGEFHRDAAQADGHNGHCAKCRCRRDRKYRSTVSIENRTKRSPKTLKEREMDAIRRLTRKTLGTPKRCAVARCSRKSNLEWHHMTRDHLTVIGLCPIHHKLVHHP
jgi:hypothetical protein